MDPHQRSCRVRGNPKLTRRLPAVEPLESRTLLSGFQYLGTDPDWTLQKMDLIRWDSAAKKEIPGGAWDITEGDSSVIVAMLDNTGVDWEDSHIRDHLWTNPNDPVNGIDDDGNARIDDIHGWNFGVPEWNNDTNVEPAPNTEYHGTAAAETLAARGDDALPGPVGVNWNVQIMPVKFVPFTFHWAIDYIVDLRVNHGVNVRVINLGYGLLYHSFNQDDYDALSRARDAGILVVAAAGNSDINLDNYALYPPSYDLDNIITVTQSDPNDQLSRISGGAATDSGYGPNTVDIAAPHIFGTSFATPEVSALAALAFTIAPDASYATVRNAILNGADRIPALEPYVAQGRRVNARRTLELLNPATITVNGDQAGLATDDTIILRKNPANPAVLQVLVNGVEQPRFARAFSTLSSVAVNGIGGNDTIIVDGGFPATLRISGGAGSNVLRLTGTSGGLSISPNSATFGATRITYANSRMELGGGGTQTLSSLGIAPGARLDLRDTTLLVRNGNYRQISAWIDSARDASPLWSGPGLTSSMADADRGLVPMLLGPDVRVMLTLNGDLNQDGKVNADDYFRIDQGFLIEPPAPTYQDGDLNFDGRVNADDYFLIDQAFLNQ